MLDKQSTQIESALRFAGYLPYVWFHAFCFRECRGHVTPGICRLLHCQLHGFRIPLVLRRYRRSHMFRLGAGSLLAYPRVASCAATCHVSHHVSCRVNALLFTYVHALRCVHVRDVWLSFLFHALCRAWCLVSVSRHVVSLRRVFRFVSFCMRTVAIIRAAINTSVGTDYTP